MQWIEEWFGVDPDGGSGALEILLIVALAFVIMSSIYVYKVRKAAHKKSEH